MLLIRLLSLLLPPLALIGLSWPANAALASWALVPMWLCVPLYGLLLGGGVSVVGAFVFGLLVDTLLHGVLGVWALGLGAPTLLLRLSQNRSLSQPLRVQIMVVGGVLLTSNFLIFYWLGWLHTSPMTYHWLPVVVAIALWAPLALFTQRPEANF